ncbi:carboxypeptidase Taq [Nitrosospira multiformis]|uniref:Metal-dependent carboxypeptidase n=1 Tax=Nitrosospira multiformis TaxID=1231 RepID=A0A2T5IGP2_9PROT|nr:carboxypeptidase M32 [Nitrosospira multiformis]PTQ83007.1 carboxypeptidase Taq [Nitrosospira multiformis]
MYPALQSLKARFAEIDDLRRAVSVLHWDMSTHMPQDGTTSRGRMIATVEKAAHEKLIDPDLATLLEETAALPDAMLSADDRAFLRLARRQFVRASKIPSGFKAEFFQHMAETYEAWVHARKLNDFNVVAPFLEKTVAYSRALSDFFNTGETAWAHPMDPHIEDADPGMTTTAIKTLFADLRRDLVPLVREVSSRSRPRTDFLSRAYPKSRQLEFLNWLARNIGYDFNRGRQDLTHHPFMTKLGAGDVRITTRISEANVCDGIFSTIHECGHAFYELGLSPSLDGTILGHGTSAGIHESQSRLWENQVGRSREFWTYFYPHLQTRFSEALGDVSLEEFYCGINRVEPSLIRTEADEVTYNLHVMIRFDIESQLLDGSLQVKDLPAAWNDRYEADLGVRPSSDAQGCLQDVHWYYGSVGGMFQGYTIGNLFSAQCFEAALEAHPEIPEAMMQGNFSTLHSWLKENIYQYGSSLFPQELIRRMTGHDLSSKPFVAYLTRKYL